jgi:hypothetical protein
MTGALDVYLRSAERLTDEQRRLLEVRPFPHGPLLPRGFDLTAGKLRMARMSPVYPIHTIAPHAG